jgi:hypothetical protein
VRGALRRRYGLQYVKVSDVGRFLGRLVRRAAPTAYLSITVRS